MNIILFKYLNFIYLYINLIDKFAVKFYKFCENVIFGFYYFFNYIYFFFNNL